jgi:hypothetical protein
VTQQQEVAVKAAALILHSVVVEPVAAEAAPAVAVSPGEPEAAPVAQAAQAVAGAVPVEQAVLAPEARPLVGAATLSTLAPRHTPCPMMQVRYSRLVGGPDLTKFALPYREAVSDPMKSDVHCLAVPESARADKPQSFRLDHVQVVWAELVV